MQQHAKIQAFCATKLLARKAYRCSCVGKKFQMTIELTA